jgi:hypothetical protein
MGRMQIHGIALTLAVATALFAAPARANQGSCTPAQARLEANTWVSRIATATTVDEARELALEPTRGAHFALSQAQVVAFWSEDLTRAGAELDDYQGRIDAAATPQDVANQAAQLVNGGIYADVNGSCSYSTGEVVATVIGFVLGILPGIILMILLC